MGKAPAVWVGFLGPGTSKMEAPTYAGLLEVSETSDIVAK
jgi:hypothetical protein